jgi:hypothetical protein
LATTSTGALQVVGGVGIGGNLYIGGDLGTTNSLLIYLIHLQLL